MRVYRLRKQPTDTEFADLVAFLGAESIARVYWYKNLHNKQDITAFTSVDNLLPTEDLFDVHSFYERLKAHKVKNSKVVIYGDYDADGAVAAAIFFRFLKKVLNMNVTVYIPDRHEEGYGLNKQALETLAKQGIDLVITVDCGVRDGALIADIMQKTSMEIMVTDHHEPGEIFPTCVTVHPLFPQHESINKHTSGGVVAWKVVRFLEEKFGVTHAFSDSVVDLAGISLVTDIMPLIGENRAILKRALQKMRNNPTIGVRVLAEVAQIPIPELSTYHLGYVIGPRLNASGRIGDQYTSTRLLSTDNIQKAREYALETQEINLKRQQITKLIQEEAEKQKEIIADKMILAAAEGWDDGIIGLVAGRLMNTHNMPTLAISIDTQKQLAKGSARSFGDFNITEFLSKVSFLLERYGGHKNAAGFTLKAPDIQTFSEQLKEILQKEYTTYVPVLESYIDAIVHTEQLTEDFFGQLSLLEPFGQGNNTPLFAAKGKVSQFSTFGQQGNHVRVDLQTESGFLKGLAFDAIPLLEGLEQGKEIVLIGKPKIDEYQGRKSPVFFIDDIVTVLPEE